MSIYVAFESIRHIDLKVKHLQINMGGGMFLKGGYVYTHNSFEFIKLLFKTHVFANAKAWVFFFALKNLHAPKELCKVFCYIFNWSGCNSMRTHVFYITIV
jgi:hypothetical protein